MFDLAEVTLEEQEFGPEETEAADLEDGQDMQEDTGSGIIRIKDEDDVHLMTKDDTCLVYKKCLLKLASTKVKYEGEKSTNMERACFLKAMEDLEENGVHVSEVVTDAHLQIGAVMSKYLVLYYSILSLSLSLSTPSLSLCMWSNIYIPVMIHFYVELQ